MWPLVLSDDDSGQDKAGAPLRPAAGWLPFGKTNKRQPSLNLCLATLPELETCPAIVRLLRLANSSLQSVPAPLPYLSHFSCHRQLRCRCRIIILAQIISTHSLLACAEWREWKNLLPNWTTCLFLHELGTTCSTNETIVHSLDWFLAWVLFFKDESLKE